MEAAALTRPPERLERIVSFLIPPAAREVVAGDLCETYRAPSQYILEALRTVPFVVISQMRRNANWPLLGLQAFLIFVCLGGFSISYAGAAQILLPLAAVLLLLLRGAYQATGRPSTQRAIIETIIAAYGALAYSQGVMLNLSVVRHLPHHALLGIKFSLLMPLVPLVPPLLCLFRALMIIRGDGNRPFPSYTVKQQDVINDYALFARRIRRRNQHEAAALGIAMVCGLIYFRALPASYMSVALALIIAYGLSAFYLVSDGAVRLVPKDTDFQSLRALYVGELARQQQLRRFLLWLWLAPLLIALRAVLTISEQPAEVMLGNVAVILSCFIISAPNREHGGWVQEKIGMLDRMPEENLSARSCVLRFD